MRRLVLPAFPLYQDACGVRAMLPSRPASLTPKRNRWLAIAIIGGITVAAGIALPQAMSSLPSTAAPLAAVGEKVADPEGKSKWSYTPPGMPDAPDARSMLVRLGAAT